MKTKWDEMLPGEFEEAIEAFPLCYLPLGTLERHGRHLPFGLDGLKAYGFCLRTAEKIGGIVAPPLHIGTHGYWADDFKRSESIKQPAGSVYISEGVLFNILMEVFRELEYSGFKAVIVFSGHYPVQQTGTIRRAAEQYMQSSQIKIKTFSDPDLSGEIELSFDHAGKYETSFMMELRPELVDMTDVPDISTPEDDYRFCNKSLHEATPELGSLYTDYVVEKLSVIAKEMID